MFKKVPLYSTITGDIRAQHALRTSFAMEAATAAVVEAAVKAALAQSTSAAVFGGAHFEYL